MWRVRNYSQNNKNNNDDNNDDDNDRKQTNRVLEWKFCPIFQLFAYDISNTHTGVKNITQPE